MIVVTTAVHCAYEKGTKAFIGLAARWSSSRSKQCMQRIESSATRDVIIQSKDIHVNKCSSLLLIQFCHAGLSPKRTFSFLVTAIIFSLSSSIPQLLFLMLWMAFRSFSTQDDVLQFLPIQV
jgi:hypothetical protein